MLSIQESTEDKYLEYYEEICCQNSSNNLHPKAYVLSHIKRTKFLNNKLLRTVWELTLFGLTAEMS